MFDRPGNTIKRLATIFFVICVIVSVYFAFRFGVTEQIIARNGRYETVKRFQALPFFGIIIGGIVGSYITSLFIAAFGELVDSSEQNQRNTLRILQKLESKDSPSAKPSTDRLPPLSSFTSESTGNNNYIACPWCGEYQERSRTTCKVCGKPLH